MEINRLRFLRSVALSVAVVSSANGHDSQTRLAEEGRIPDLSGAIGWVNSPPLNPEWLRGKVVLVDFWTYTCISSLRPLPYVKNWAPKYNDAGLIVMACIRLNSHSRKRA